MSFFDIQNPGINIGSTSSFTVGEITTLINLADDFVYANDYAGADIGAQVNAAYAALPSAGGAIWIKKGTYSYSTPIVFGTVGKIASLRSQSAGSTFLKFTPTSGNAFTINSGNPTGHLVYEVSGITFMGKSSLIAAGQTNTNTSVGIYLGGSNGAPGVNIHDCNINGFGTNLEIGANAYMINVRNCSISGGNGGQSNRGSLVHINTASNSGERNNFSGCNFTDPGNSIATGAIYITNSGTASNSFTQCSFDDVQIFIGASDGQTSIISCHFENAAFGTYGAYIPVLGVSSDSSTQITFIGNVIANDTSGANSFDTIIKHGGQLYAASNNIQNYGGGTISAFVDHSLNNGTSSDFVVQTQVQGGTLTNIIAGSGGVAHSRASGAAALQNVANSYTIGMRAQGTNTNEFFSGSNTVATFNHTGDWTFGISGSSSGSTFYSKGTIYKSAAGALGPELVLNNPADTGSGDQFAISAYDGGSGSPYRAGLLWTLGNTGLATLEIKGGNAGQTSIGALATIASFTPTTFIAKDANSRLDASTFAGADIGAKINAAYLYGHSTLGLQAVDIFVPAGVYSYSTPIVFGVLGKRVHLWGITGAGTELQYTGSSGTKAITINTGEQNAGSNHTSYVAIENITLTGNRRSTSSPVIGVYCGGSNGAAHAVLRNVVIQTFGQGAFLGQHTYHFSMDSVTIRDCGQLMYVDAANDSGEAIHLFNCFFSDAFDATYATSNAIQFADSAVASCVFVGCSFDDMSMRVGQANNITTIGCHWENPGSANWGAYTYLVIDSNIFGATNFTINGDTFFSTGATAPTNYINNGCNLVLNGVVVRDFIGSTMTNMIALTSPGQVTWTGLNNVVGTAFTNIVSGVAYVPQGFANQAGNVWKLSATGVMTATNAVLITPALGTPSSGTLTNTTGLPISGLVSSTSTALGLGSVELGHATDTTIARVSAGVISVEGVTVLTTSSTNTLTNKSISAATNSITVDGTNGVGFRELPQNSKSAAYTTVMSDSGKHIYHPSADTTARTWTIDSNANVAYPVGTTITFVNDTSGGVITIAITSDTLVLAGAGTTGSRSLAANGVATAIKVTSTRWIINGTNLT